MNKILISLIFITCVSVTVFALIEYSKYDKENKTQADQQSIQSRPPPVKYVFQLGVYSRDDSNNVKELTNAYLWQSVNKSLVPALYEGTFEVGKTWKFSKDADSIYLEIPDDNYPLGINATNTVNPSLNPYMLKNYTHVNLSENDTKSFLFKLNKDEINKVIDQGSEFTTPVIIFYLDTYSIPAKERIAFIKEIKLMSCNQLENWQIEHIGENQDYSNLVNDLSTAKCEMMK